MILYHGSNTDIVSIDLSRSSVGKDFGCGFYLTVNREQAERMGRRKARLYGGEMIVSTFEFDEKAALGLVYNSDTYEKILDLGTGLFSQSTSYVYAILARELTEGKVIDH